MSLLLRSALNAFRTAVLLTGLLLSLNHQVDGQPSAFPRIRLEHKEWTLEELCNAIKKKTGFLFFFGMDKEKRQKMFVGADGEYLDDFLNRVLLPRNLFWKVIGHTISIRPYASELLTPAEVRRLRYNSGYHDEPFDTLTAAVSIVHRGVLDLKVSSNLPDALENNVTGVLFNHGGPLSNNGSPNAPEIRGQSTILSDPTPLSVVDNSVYYGGILNLNPEDIQSMVVLKDAAATARYGVRAGNGVFVITTKRGSSSTPQVQYSSSLTWQSRPGMASLHPITAADEIAYEQNAYQKGLYANEFSDPLHPGPVPPVASLLQAAADGRVTATDAANRLAAWSGIDSRKDISRYLYSSSLALREHIGISGATAGHSYYYGFGYDHQPSTLVDANVDRYTFRTENSFTLNNRWSVDADAGFTQSVQTNGDNPGANYRSLHGGRGFPAYQRLVGRDGQALPVFTDYNPEFLRQLNQLGYTDAYYRPVADIGQEQNSVQTTDYVADAGLRYRPRTWIDAELSYSLEYQLAQGKDVFTDSAYFMRDMQNTFAQRDSSGTVSYLLPAGGLANISNSNLTSNQARLQVNLHPTWNDDHRLTALAGGELHSEVNSGNSFRYYGYDEGISAVNSALNFNTSYYSWLTGTSSMIPNPARIFRTTDHFLSAYLEGLYVDHKRLYATLSMREDAANLFGVRTNQKAIPLWSCGLGYELDSLHFYHWQAVPLLKIRGNYGVSGNIGRQASAYTTAAYSNAGVTTNLPNATIQTPPNDRLRWEKVAQFDAGLDFAVKGDVVSGSYDYYLKSASDLMGEAPMDPTLGLVSSAGSPAYFYSNVASMHGHGMEGRITAQWIKTSHFRWSTDLLVTQSVTKVTRYFPPVTTGNAYLNPNVVNPVPGKPLYAVYSYQWKGLDPATGDPQGLYGGRPSKSWDSIWANTPVNGMVYHGSSEPTWYGSLRNTVDQGHWSLTVLLSFKLGYYFRRPSISYSDLQNLWIGNSDYARRWQQSGDEKRTNVPSATYNADPLRDNFYAYSSILVEKGDQMRLEDIRLSHFWELGKRQVSVFADAANLGAIWRANKAGVDPSYINTPTDSRRWSVGVRATF